MLVSYEELTKENTLAEEIEAVAWPEEIISCCIATLESGLVWRDSSEIDHPGAEDALNEWEMHPIPDDKRGVRLPWSEVRPYLDYHFDHGYGSVDVHALNAESASYILFIVVYDGKSRVHAVRKDLLWPQHHGG